MMEVDPEEEEATTAEEEATEETPQAVGIEEEATEDPGVKEEEITTAAAAAAEENGEAEEEINRRIRRIPHRRVPAGKKTLCGVEDRLTVGRKNEHNESGKKLHHRDPAFTWTGWEISEKHRDTSSRSRLAGSAALYRAAIGASESQHIETRHR
eukprot:GHVU01043375.1.p2 GENE.GHVU01043375.1~~GHVU01043375.1.p2  ORF type:complete len:154 (+),score=42.79 GHVU01043375.1:66-527(+)